MKLAKLLTADLVVAGLDVKTKNEAVTALLQLVGKRYPLLDIAKITEAVEERERIENTAYGHGFAFPHARTDQVGRMYIAMAVTRHDLGDRTPDGEPLRVICLMLTPSNISQLYLQALSAFARFAREPENTQRLWKAKTPSEIITIVYDSGVTVNRDLLVRDIMVEKVISVTPEHSLKDVANLLYEHRIGSMPVADADGKVVGIISNRDLIKAALPDYKALISNLALAPEVEPFDEFLKHEDDIKVYEVMETTFETTTEDSPVVELAAMMLFKDLRLVPVLRDEKLVGVVVTSDLVSKIIRG
ncbi:MAG: PTS sugar transporter subunit IIA [bacterium]